MIFFLFYPSLQEQSSFSELIPLAAGVLVGTDTAVKNGEFISSMGEKENKSFDWELGYKMKNRIAWMKKSGIGKGGEDTEECQEVYN